MDAKTAGPNKPKTLVNVSLSIGDQSVWGTALATMTTPITNKDAIRPEKTTWSAFFFPYNSDIRSVTKKVIGYGKIPTDNSNVNNPNGVQVKNFWKIRLALTREAIKMPARMR